MFEVKNLPMLILFIAIAFLPALIAQMVSPLAFMTYAALSLPVWAPPGWLFGIVWSILYFLMGWSAYQVWSSDAEKEKKRSALILWGIQLLVNAAWTPIFFGLQSYVIAFGVLIALCYFVGLTVFEFSEIRITSARMLYPYMLWLFVALALNGYVVIYN